LATPVPNTFGHAVFLLKPQTSSRPDGKKKEADAQVCRNDRNCLDLCTTVIEGYMQKKSPGASGFASLWCLGEQRMSESALQAEQLLAAARDGSREALGRLFQACRPYLLVVAARQLDPELLAKGSASDLVQESFLEAQRDFARFAGTTEAELLAWLRQILLNNAGNFSRRYRDTDKRAVSREVSLAGEDSAHPSGPSVPDLQPTPSSKAIEREQAEALQRALQCLPDDYRRIIVYRYLEGRSFDEIGRLMQRSADAARKLWSRAMDELRQEWEGST
jgi:RNA polymerase sigma-70 factor, ECF subfamily